MPRFKLGDIQPNPFRHLERYPIKPEKIAALRASIIQTGFWDNIVARVNPEGKPEIAYGHHRMTALREEYDAEHEIDLITRGLSDETMLKMMAAENMEEYKSDFAVVMETVRAVVIAFGEGKISLGPIHRFTPLSTIRYAPSFVVGNRNVELPEHAPEARYTVESVGKFIGWERSGYRVDAALKALELIEQRRARDSEFIGDNIRQAVERIERRRRQRPRRPRPWISIRDMLLKMGQDLSRLGDRFDGTLNSLNPILLRLESAGALVGSDQAALESVRSKLEGLKTRADEWLSRLPPPPPSREPIVVNSNIISLPRSNDNLH